MIQRIQSVFMFFSIVVSILLFFFPAVSFVNLNETIIVSCNPFATIEKMNSTFYIVAILNLFLLTSLVYALFSFKKRKIQIQFNSYSIICTLLLIACFVGLPFLNSAEYTKQINWLFYLLPISVISLFLSIKFIKKDEELVRSADRIR
jgi:hypothetical protein